MMSDLMQLSWSLDPAINLVLVDSFCLAVKMMKSHALVQP
jgi:hypothetical protein